jgi:uncharacterized membrane protein
MKKIINAVMALIISVFSFLTVLFLVKTHEEQMDLVSYATALCAIAGLLFVIFYLYNRLRAIMQEKKMFIFFFKISPLKKGIDKEVEEKLSRAKEKALESKDIYNYGRMVNLAEYWGFYHLA